jgi:hypothetical protein
VSNTLRLAACTDPYKLPYMDGSNAGAPHISTTELLSRLLDAHGVAYRIGIDTTGEKRFFADGVEPSLITIHVDDCAVFVRRMADRLLN